MKFYTKWVRRLLRDTRGQDLIEYALLSGFVFVVVAAFFPTQLAPSINTVFSKVASTMIVAGSSGS